MKNRRYAALLAGLVALLVLSQAGAEEKLVSGKDRIDVPAIGEGLCLHNLFQSGMVLQRDKPIRVWGWAEPGETSPWPLVKRLNPAPLPPTIQEMKVEGGNMILKLDASDAIAYNDGPILGFAIAGKDGKFQPAKAVWGTNVNKKEDHSLIVLSSPLVAEPVYYRHAWGRNPLANLKADGIPLDTLRNDNFTVADMYEIYTGKKSATPNILDAVEFRELRNALKAEDVKRRLNEAETFIKEQAAIKAAEK